MKEIKCFILICFIIIHASYQSESQPDTKAKELTQEELEAQYTSDFIFDITPELLESTVKANDFTLVVFYFIEKTHYCRKIFNILEDMKDFFNENKIKVVKVNARIFESFFFKFGFKILPGLILYQKGKSDGVIYELDQNKNDISTFLKKKVNPIATPLHSLDDVNRFREKHDIVVIQVGIKVPSESLLKTSMDYSYVLFGFCKSIDCFQLYNQPLYNEVTNNEEGKLSYDENKEYISSDYIILFSAKKNQYYVINNNIKENIEKLIDENSHPNISEINERSLHRLFKTNKETFILFDTESKSNLSILESASSKLSTYGLILMYSDPTQPYNRELMNQVGVTKASLPIYIILKKNENMDIYKPNYFPTKFEKDSKPITKHALINFANDWKYDLIKPVMKSQPIPANPKNGNVYKLVGHNFMEIISNPEMAVLVKFYSDECKYCKEFAPTFDELARVVAPSKDILVAEVDIKENFVPIQIKSLPLVILFTKGDPKNNIIYEFDRNLLDLILFLRYYSNTEVETIKEDF